MYTEASKIHKLFKISTKGIYTLSGWEISY